MAKIRPGYYEYIEKYSGVVFVVKFVPEWSVPKWTSYPADYHQDSFGDVLSKTKKGAYEVIIEEAERVYSEIDGMDKEEIWEYTKDPYMNGFKKSIARAVSKKMKDDEIFHFDFDVKIISK